MKMKKILASALCLALALAAFAGCGGDASSPAPAASGSVSGAAGTASTELNLYTWEGMFPQEVLDAFTEETGIKINYSSFDTDETMLAKLETANGGDYDVVIADDYIIETAIAEGLVKPLDKSLIPNFGNINPAYQGQFFDRTTRTPCPMARACRRWYTTRRWWTGKSRATPICGTRRWPARSASPATSA